MLCIFFQTDIQRYQFSFMRSNVSNGKLRFGVSTAYVPVFLAYTPSRDFFFKYVEKDAIFFAIRTVYM